MDGLLGEGGGSKVLLVRHSPSDHAGTPAAAEVTPGGEIVPRSHRDCAEMAPGGGTPNGGAPGGGTRGGRELSEFALKCISKRLLAARGTALHAVRERRALQACDHPKPNPAPTLALTRTPTPTPTPTPN